MTLSHGGDRHGDYCYGLLSWSRDRLRAAARRAVTRVRAGVTQSRTKPLTPSLEPGPGLPGNKCPILTCPRQRAALAVTVADPTLQTQNRGSEYPSRSSQKIYSTDPERDNDLPPYDDNDISKILWESLTEDQLISLSPNDADGFSDSLSPSDTRSTTQRPADIAPSHRPKIRERHEWNKDDTICESVARILVTGQVGSTIVYSSCLDYGTFLESPLFTNENAEQAIFVVAKGMESETRGIKESVHPSKHPIKRMQQIFLGLGD